MVPSPKKWHYFVALKLSIQAPTAKMQNRDDRVLLTDARVLNYDELSEFTSSPVIIAVPITSTSDLITGALRIAGTPQNLGAPFSVILDQRFPVHFLCWTNGAWYSTNILRTSKMAFTVTKEKAKDND